MLKDRKERIVDNITDDSLEVLPFKYTITSYGADYPVDALVKRIEKSDIFIPPFQRQYVWTYKQASRFIESLLLGLPVPGIFLAKETKSSRLLVIDGNQRIRTLQYFYNGLFKERKFSLKNVQKQFEGKTYKTLVENDRIKLDDSIIHATIVKQDVPSEDQSSVYHIFERLNTGGALLQAQEIRACIYHGEFNNLLDKFNENREWREIFGRPNERLKDQELILRFFALYFYGDNYKRPMRNFLNCFMAGNRDLKKYSEQQLGVLFVPTLEAITKAIGKNVFRPVKTINAAVCDAVMVGIANRLKKNPIKNLNKIKENYNSLLKNPKFIEAYTSGTSSEEKVKDRLKLAIQAFSDIA